MKHRFNLIWLPLWLVVSLAACASEEDIPPLSTPPAATAVTTARAGATRVVEGAVDAPVPPPTVAPGVGMVKVEAARDQVTVERGGVATRLPFPQSMDLTIGDGVSVDEQGKATLRFDPSPVLDVLRRGQLQYEARQQGVLTQVQLNFGTFFGAHTPLAPEDVLEVTTEYAIIKVTGTQFLVVRESNTPLEWVITLDAHGDNDVTVAAKSGVLTQPVPSGIARWMAPIGEASRAVSYDQSAVEQWLQQVENGETVPEVGRVLWPEAELSTTMEPITALPPNGDPFALDGVTLTLKSGVYGLEDCNRDGIEDVAMQDGVLQMDFRGLLARVGNLEAEVFNRAIEGRGWLKVFNPAYEEIDVNELQVATDQSMLLVLDADNPLNLPPDQLPGQPYHFAELTLSDGCLIRFGSQPSQVAPSPQRVEPEVCVSGANGLLLRAGPGQNSPAVGTLRQGAAMAAIARSEDGAWISVHTADGRDGWVSASLVTCAAGALSEASPLPTAVCVTRRPTGWGTYRVQSGDTLSGIAQRSCGSIGAIAAANCLEPSRVLAGSTIYVPRCAPPPTAVAPTEEPVQSLPDLVMNLQIDAKQMICERRRTEGVVILPVKATITNRGAAVAGPSLAVVEVPGDDAEPLLRIIESDTLSAGASATYSVWFELPTTLEQATIAVQGMADSCLPFSDRRPAYCQVRESNEGNNWSPQYAVQVIPNQAPIIEKVEVVGNLVCSWQEGGSAQANVRLNATATDCEDGTLTGDELTWTVDGGSAGTGASWSTTLLCDPSYGGERSKVSETTHTILLTVTDSQGAKQSKTIAVTVQLPPPID